jgi:release factor glutamine methyltransferase
MLAEAGVPDAPRDARKLLVFALGRDPAFLYAHPEYQLRADEDATFSDFVTRRAGREPLQYISGSQEFCGHDFEVTRDVLIPRPETEMIVERAVELAAGSLYFCEPFIGSGCIAVSILMAIPESRGVGLDISTHALRVAARNAAHYSVADRLSLRTSDIFERVGSEELFQMIVANPPYVSTAEFKRLQPEVRDHEPAIALTDGGDGLGVIRRLIIDAPHHIEPGGTLLMEIGFGQREEVEGMFASGPWADVTFRPDTLGIPRLCEARRLESS